MQQILPEISPFHRSLYNVYCYTLHFTVLEIFRRKSMSCGHYLDITKTIPFQLESALRNIYNYLQRFAVGLEEIVLDQALFDGEFIQEFNEAEYKLKAVSVSAV